MTLKRSASPSSDRGPARRVASRSVAQAESRLKSARRAPSFVLRHLRAISISIDLSPLLKASIASAISRSLGSRALGSRTFSPWFDVFAAIAVSSSKISTSSRLTSARVFWVYFRGLALLVLLKVGDVLSQADNILLNPLMSSKTLLF
jgi:hypothetical protein